MKRKIFSALASSALMLTLAPSGASAAYAVHDGHDHAHAWRERTQHSKSARALRRVSKARKRTARRASVSYACPMHPDMRSRTRGECPKCGMALVAAGRKARAGGENQTEIGDEGHSNP
jgi:Heavy metal binding domain